MDDREWTSYHPEGKRIFTAYAAGVNAFIAEHAGNLPVEFKLTGLTPESWTAETLLLRAGSFGDASAELTLARNVVRLGVAEANRQRAPDPWDDLTVPEGLDLSIIDQGVVIPGGRGAGGGGRGGNQPAIIEPYRTWIGGRGFASDSNAGEIAEPGSNNWVISGRMSATGKPIVANDPHRTVTNPVAPLHRPSRRARLERDRRRRAAVRGRGDRPQRSVGVGPDDRRHRSGRCLRRGS